MAAIKKILFPVDFSPRCQQAAPYVAEMAGWFEAELMLLHVVEPGANTLAEELKTQKQTQLGSFFVEELKHFRTQRVCLTGDPAEKIAEIARSWPPDLVMMPTHGLGFFRSYLLGSVTAKVLHDAACPVWTSVHEQSIQPLEKIKSERVLCAIDLCPRSGEILAWAGRFAREHQALTVVHVTPGIEAAAMGRFLDDEYVAALTHDADAEIANLLASAKIDAEVRIAGGSIAHTIKNIASDLAADLMIIGRHSSARFAGHLRHNAYAILRESPCPVISI